MKHRTQGAAAAFAAGIILLAGGWALTAQHGPRVLVPGPQPGQVAPEYSAATFEGDSVSLASYRGTVVLLNFWATWCKPCVAEIPALEDLQRRYKEAGLTILAVSLDKKRSAAQRFVRDHALAWRNLIDRDTRVMSVFAVSKGVPKSVLIDRDGTVRAFWYGTIDSAKAHLVGAAVTAAPVQPTL